MECNIPAAKNILKIVSLCPATGITCTSFANHIWELISLRDCSMPFEPVGNILYASFLEKLALSEIIIDENDFEEEIIDHDETLERHLESNEEILVEHLAGDNAVADGQVEEDPDDDAEAEEKPILTLYDRLIARLVKHCPLLRDVTLESHFISGGTGK